MILILSPTKSLDFNFDSSKIECTTPIFIEHAAVLAKKLKTLFVSQVSKLMNLSEDLSELNHKRFQEWNMSKANNGKPAILAFNGSVYQGLAAKELDDEQLAFAQKHVRILSGLYGILKPLDKILPHRLEMGTRLTVTPKIKNLYQFWDKIILKKLTAAFEGQEKVVINLASQEYAKAAQLKNFRGKVITCTFKEKRENGDFKVIATFAKIARGLMTRFVIDNRITDPEQLKAFDIDRYGFNHELSTEEEFVFTR